VVTTDVAPPAPAGEPVAPMTVLRSRKYLGLLGLAAALGVPISAVAYWFLALVGALVLGMVTNVIYFAGIPSSWQEFVKGLVVVIALGFMVLEGRRRA